MKITNAMTPAAVLEQLAEECAELGQAALKYARILRKENPTPVTESEAIRNFFEELADVRLVVRIIELEITGNLDTFSLEVNKEQRWLNRLKRKAATQRQEEDVAPKTTKVIIRKVKRNEQNP